MAIKNRNYVFVFYDVNEKRVNKVFKACKKYLIHHQKSVFRGEITPSKLIQLKSMIDTIIDSEEDFISFIEMTGQYVFHEETMGTNPKEKRGETDLFL